MLTTGLSFVKSSKGFAISNKLSGISQGDTGAPTHSLASLGLGVAFTQLSGRLQPPGVLTGRDDVLRELDQHHILRAIPNASTLLKKRPSYVLYTVAVHQLVRMIARSC